MTIHNNSWPFMLTHYHSWSFMAIHDNSCWFMTIHDDSWWFKTVQVISWQFMTVHDCSWCFMTQFMTLNFAVNCHAFHSEILLVWLNPLSIWIVICKFIFKRHLNCDIYTSVTSFHYIHTSAIYPEILIYIYPDLSILLLANLCRTRGAEKNKAGEEDDTEGSKATIQNFNHGSNKYTDGSHW